MIELEKMLTDPDLQDPRNPYVQMDDGSVALLRACGELHVQQELSGIWSASAHSYNGKMLIDQDGDLIIGTGATLQEALSDLILEVEYL